MIRLFLSFAFTILAARWIYAEIALMVPDAIPAIDYALHHVQIPTHDKWDTEAIGIMTRDMGFNMESISLVQTAEAADFSSRGMDYGSPNYGIRYTRPGNNRPCSSGACDMF